MFFHKSRLILSPEAQKDFISILRYTGERWGRAQLLIYRDKLNDALMLLSENPQLGHPSMELPTPTVFILWARMSSYIG
jgi:plasmid stabilization system protein ParE